VIQNIAEHHQNVSKHILCVAILVLGVDEHPIIVLVSMEAQIASEVVGSQFPVHSGLIVDIEIS
jgi:hypothetical protein